MEAKPLDSISTIASTTTISSSDKENIDNVASSSDFKESNQQPDCKTSIGDSIDGFSDCTFDDIRHNLTMDTSLLNIARVMKHPDSKLASATRSYCNMKLPRSFTGISIIEWLLAYVKGLHTGKEARALAQRLVNSRYIRCPLAGKQNSVGFSENSLYVFSNQLNELTDILNDIIEEDEEDLQESTANSKDRNGNRNSYSLDNQSEPNSISSKQKINGSLNNSRNSSSIIMKKPPKVARQSSIRKSGKFASVV
ncbi:MAG: Segment polarity protein dishevelled DVL-3 [Paramarteilia canceri]